MAGQRVPHSRQLLGATHQFVVDRRQHTTHLLRRLSDDLTCQQHCRQPRTNECPCLLRCREAGEFHLPGLLETETLRGAIRQQPCSRVRHQHTTRRAHTHQPGDPVHRRTEHVAVTLVHHTRVDRRAYLHPIGLLPGGLIDRALDRSRRTHRRNRIIKHRDHPVTRVLHHTAAGPDDTLAQHPVVQLEVRGHRHLIGSPPTRRPHDVGHHQRHQRRHVVTRMRIDLATIRIACDANRRKVVGARRAIEALGRCGAAAVCIA